MISPPFFDSFDYTTTGRNLCHPRVLGLVVKTAWTLPGVAAVDIDVKLNLGGKVKFQPDVVAVDCEGKPLIIADFESPNSSDARIPEKDVKPYLAWAEKSAHRVPYFIITALPRVPRSWELRWTAAGKWNDGHWEHRAHILKSPFEYWYGWYRKTVTPMLEAKGELGKTVNFLNIAEMDVQEIQFV